MRPSQATSVSVRHGALSMAASFCVFRDAANRNLHRSADPLNLGTLFNFKYMQEAEIKHGKYCAPGAFRGFW